MSNAWIDNMLPKMRCDEGCGSCCTVVGVSGADYDRVAEYARVHHVTPQRQGMRCPWFQGGTCAVYPARPFACRFYGHTEHMQCHRGYNANASPTVQRYISGRYIQSLGRADHPFHKLLHDIAYSREEIVAVVKAELAPVVTLTVKGTPVFPPDAVYDAVRQLAYQSEWPDPMRFVGSEADGSTTVEEYRPPARPGGPGTMARMRPGGSPPALPGGLRL